MSPGKRLRESIERSGLPATLVADKVGFSRQNLQRYLDDETKRSKHWTAIADAVGVDPIWLTTGTGKAPSWATPPQTQTHIELTSPRQLPIIAYVGAASDGQRGVVLDQPETMTLSDQLAVVEVRGSSAYPVLYDGQKAIVHLVRAVRPNNLAVVVLLNNDDCLIKRWCPQHNDQVVLASPDGGRDSIVIHRSAIRHVWPVVGVLFE